MHLDAPAVNVHDSFDDGQSRANALLFLALPVNLVQALEQVGDFLGRNAQPLVLHGDIDPLLVRPDLHDDGRALVREFDSIINQSPQGIVNIAHVQYRAWRLEHVFFKAHVALASPGRIFCDDGVHQRTDIGNVGLRQTIGGGRLAGFQHYHKDKVVHQVGQAIATPFHPLQKTTQIVHTHTFWPLVQNQVQVAANIGQGGAKFVAEGVEDVLLELAHF